MKFTAPTSWSATTSGASSPRHSSTVLSARAKEKGLRCLVPAFHGHSHNRGCQVHFHPLYYAGAGKEDFEGCERLFSESNGLASGTRLATPFHRHQAIEEFAKFWSLQKHAETGAFCRAREGLCGADTVVGNFIYNNYRQALGIIANDTEAFDVLAAKLSITHEDCEQYLVQEREYLAKRKTEPAEVAAKIDYVAGLLQLGKAGCVCVQTMWLASLTMRLRTDRKEAVAAKTALAAIDPFIVVNNAQAAKKREGQIRGLRTRTRTTQAHWAVAEELVLQMEEDLDIEHRWLPKSAEYQGALQELQSRKYRLALDNLERLVIQRMFELTKLGMSGIGECNQYAHCVSNGVETGYKLREKIGKALKTRAEAIRHALEEYNKCAAGLTPPRPTLAWHDIMEMVSLAEFDLLRDAREDIRKYPWAKRLNREAMNMHYNILRAREEIQRLNVEIPRLFTSLIDRHFEMQRAISLLKDSDPALAHELTVRWLYEDQISARIAARLYQTSTLPGFSGKLAAGKRVGRGAENYHSIVLPRWACHAPTPGLRGTALAGSEQQRTEDIEVQCMDSGDEGPRAKGGAPEDEDDAIIPGVDDERDAVRLVDFIDGLGLDAD